MIRNFTCHRVRETAATPHPGIRTSCESHTRWGCTISARLAERTQLRIGTRTGTGLLLHLPDHHTSPLVHNFSRFVQRERTRIDCIENRFGTCHVDKGDFNLIFPGYVLWWRRMHVVPFDVRMNACEYSSPDADYGPIWQSCPRSQGGFYTCARHRGPSDNT